MLNKIVIWDTNKYGYYTGQTARQLYKLNKLKISYTLEDNIIIIGDFPVVSANDKFYEIYTNIIDLENNVNILVAHETDLY